MTPEEAIEILQEEHDYAQLVTYVNKALNLGIEALKKQITKKPIFVDTRFRHHGKSISQGSSLSKCYKCPNCNSHIFHTFDSEKCCVYCGQALDWSDEE